MFYACNKGFQLTFSNNLVISVMFGQGNYCQNRDVKNESETTSENAEFAVFSKSSGCDIYNETIGKNNGWRTSAEIAQIIHIVSTHNGTNEELVEKIKKITQ